MFLSKTRVVRPLIDDNCNNIINRNNENHCGGRPNSSSCRQPSMSNVNNTRPSSSSCKATLQQEVDTDSDEGEIELCAPSPMLSSRPGSSARAQKSLLLNNTNSVSRPNSLQPVAQPSTLKPGSVKIPSPVLQPSLPIQHSSIMNPSPNRPPSSNGASFSQKAPPEVEESSSSEDEATPTMLQTNINTQSTRAMIPLIGAERPTTGTSNGNKNWGNPPKSINSKELAESSSSESPLLTTPIYVKEVPDERIQTNMSVAPMNHMSPGHTPRDYAGDWDDVPEVEEEVLESSSASVIPAAKPIAKPTAQSPPKKHPPHEHIPAKKRPISSRTPPSDSQETQAKTPNKTDSPFTPNSTNSTNSDPARPQTSGNWKIRFEDMELGEKLGSGGFGTVFKARSKQSGETVAVKMCICQDSDMVTAFKREIQMLSQLHHEHVVLFKGACVDPPHLCIVTEHMCMGSLYDCLQDEDMDMPWTMRLRWTRDIARGMNYLHTLSPPIVHRDLKSPNVLVNDYYMIKLCDFGMSRTKNHTLVKTKQMGGSPMWMAPECLRGEPFTEKSDVYSFGVVMWEILTREVPWEDKEMVQLVGLVGFRNQTLEIPAHNPGCPNTYLDIMKSCWEAIASDRPSFQDIVPSLEKLAISHR